MLFSLPSKYYRPLHPHSILWESLSSTAYPQRESHQLWPGDPNRKSIPLPNTKIPQLHKSNKKIQSRCKEPHAYSSTMSFEALARTWDVGSEHWYSSQAGPPWELHTRLRLKNLAFGADPNVWSCRTLNLSYIPYTALEAHRAPARRCDEISRLFGGWFHVSKLRLAPSAGTS